jgi:hypothetical protein
MGSIRVLADDGSIHEFPDTVAPGVIPNVMARYHTALAAAQSSTPPASADATSAPQNPSPAATPVPKPDGVPAILPRPNPWVDSPPTAPVAGSLQPPRQMQNSWGGASGSWAANSHPSDYVGHPGLWESLIPVWGSGREAIADYQDGDYAGAALNGSAGSF